MKTQAYCLYNDLKAKQEISSLKISILNFQNYLEELIKLIANRSLKVDYVIQNTFKTKITNQTDYNNYLRANLYAATESFKRFV